MNESITLYYRQGASDKVYHAAMVPLNGGFVVNFAFGRRGATLQTGAKTQTPVPYDDAKAVFDKLVQEKIAKGYTPGESGTPYQHAEKENRATGILPQLLNPVEEDEVKRLTKDTDHCAQEKLDGRRTLLRKVGSVVSGINRKGLVISLPSPIIKNAGNATEDFLLDGECVGDVLHVFDLLTLGEKDLRARPYGERLIVMINFLASFEHAYIEWVPTAFRSRDKTALLRVLRQSQKEGIVFKRLDAPYTSGKPASGGTQLKYKFYATASFLVTRLNPSKRSVGVSLYREDQKLAEAGNVTIPPNQAIPAVGARVEVRYLYAFKESGRIYQPVYLGERDDLSEIDCRADQLKYRAAVEDDEEN